jgi:hypothetical protein
MEVNVTNLLRCSVTNRVIGVRGYTKKDHNETDIEQRQYRQASIIIYVHSYKYIHSLYSFMLH